MLGKQEIQIDLIMRTPYQIRKIDIDEEDVIVKTIKGNLSCWKHDDVSATLSIKLPSAFTSDYTYLKVTEPNGTITNWFVLSKNFLAPNVWTLSLKRDLVREKWDKIKDSTCEIERGYVNSSNPLFYKTEGITGNLTLGKRTKLLDSNLILAYVKTFQFSNNNGAAIPEGSWKVQAGIPGYGNSPIVTETIPSTIRIFDGANSNNRTAYLKMRLQWWSNVLGTIWTGSIDSNGDYSTPDGASYVFTDTTILSGNCGQGFTSDAPPTENALNMVKNSVQGWIDFVNYKKGLGIQNLPDWMSLLGAFGDSNNVVFPSSYECVINKGTNDSPLYYKLIFTDNVKTITQTVSNGTERTEFITYTGQPWGTAHVSSYTNDNSAEGTITYHEYTIEEQFLSNTPASDDSCYTNFPATSVQVTRGAYSYNIYAFKVDDDGTGYSEDYEAQSNSGQLIVSALMGTGVGENNIPSLAGQVIDIQMCPFTVESIHNLVDTVYDIYAGASTSRKVGEYYLLNSQDVEAFVDYDLADWQSKGTSKSRVNLSEMRLVCPNNSSVATINPDILTTGNKLQFKMNGTLYPYKPIYKVTPMARNSVVFASLEARDCMLVLGGDFSATQVSSSWSDYLIGNKNVEEAQQASIANQTRNQQMQYEYQQKALRQQGSLSMNSAMLGLVGSLAGGLATGNFMMGALGVVGSLLGLGNTTTNLKLDQESLNISNTVFNNNLALNQKLFSLELGNIKAMPNTIHKITSGSYDNDFSVIIEEYYSTETEYEQFEKAIRRTGMTLNCIGKLTDYINSEYFVFAQIIESEISNFSEVEAINQELQNGLKIHYSN